MTDLELLIYLKQRVQELELRVTKLELANPEFGQVKPTYEPAPFYLNPDFKYPEAK